MIFLDLLFPPKTNCIICNNQTDNEDICNVCMDKLPFIKGQVCKICGKPLENCDLCPDCMEYTHIFECNISVFEYDELIKSLIARFKYYKERQLSKVFTKYMYTYIKNNGIKFDVIIPVPLHSSKIDERGYNQSELLARDLSYKFDTIMIKAIRRIKKTMTQTALNKEERRKNVSGAFKVVQSNMIRNKNILLIDDILTTGSTLDECAKILMKSGASRIYTATIATGRNM